MSIHRILALVLLYAICGSSGDALLSRGMKSMDPAWIAAGVGCAAAGFAIFLGLLKDVPCSVVVPAQAGSYVVTAVVCHTLLHEQVPLLRWVGTLLVSLGVSLVLVSEWQARGAVRQPARAGAATADDPRAPGVAGRASGAWALNLIRLARASGQEATLRLEAALIAGVAGFALLLYYLIDEILLRLAVG